MDWRGIRLNKIAQHVFMRQELEYQERVDGGQRRYRELLDRADR